MCALGLSTAGLSNWGELSDRLNKYIENKSYVIKSCKSSASAFTDASLSYHDSRGDATSSDFSSISHQLPTSNNSVVINTLKFLSR